MAVISEEMASSGCREMTSSNDYGNKRNVSIERSRWLKMKIKASSKGEGGDENVIQFYNGSDQ